MQQDSRYDYTVAGFDPFLDRSIDGAQGSLGDPSKSSRAFSFDRSQIGGSLGDIWQLGNIQFNGRDEAIEFVDNRNKPLLLGKDNYGDLVLKIAPLGVDAASASDDELVFNSKRQPVILDGEIDTTYKVFLTDAQVVSGSVSFSFPHKLPFTPRVIGSFKSAQSAKAQFQLPLLLSGTSHISVTSTDENNIYLDVSANDGLGISFFLFNDSLTFRFECYPTSK